MTTLYFTVANYRREKYRPTHFGEDPAQEWNKFLTLLKENFSSVTNYEWIYFDFTDPADEAFFLVWASDGIVI